MTRLTISLLAASLVASGADRFRIVTVDPGHFHAALIQKESLPEIADDAYLYAPLGPDLTAHLNRIVAFNLRAQNPTHWRLTIYAASDFWQRMLAERKGDIIVLSGLNRGKIGRIGEIAQHRMHALADKPWIIESEDLPKVAAVLDEADRQKVVLYDGMTQRYEISYILQKELVSDPAVFGKPATGTPTEPAARMESVHYLFKLVAGVPNLRPVWFFDVRQQGEGLADVGTHLVDLMHWILFPEQAIDYRRDIRVLAGSHWPTVLKRAEFERVTGEKAYPEYLKPVLKGDDLEYYCNNSVTYTLRGIHTRLDIKWGFEAQPGASDTELAIFHGSRSSVEMRQAKEESFRPEVYVVPNSPAEKAGIAAALRRRIDALSSAWPGLRLEDQGSRFRVAIPDALRIGHEAHFALLIRKFLGYVRDPRSLPAWEKPNMTAKYYVTTKGVELARNTR